MPISTREQGIFLKNEAVFGTAETLAAGDALQVFNLQPNPVENLRMIDREIIRSSLNPQAPVYGGSLFGFQFDCEIKGSGTAGTAPRFGRALRACALTETIVALTSVTYKPTSTLSAHEGCTIGYKAGGVYRIVKGCRGSVSFTFGSGQIPKATFKFVGRIHSEADAAAPTPTFESTSPPPFLGATFQVGGYAAAIESLSLDLANTLSISPDPNKTDGYADVRITARKSTGKFNPEAQLIATKDWIGILRGGTSQAIQTGVIGATGGNRWAFNVPLATFTNINYGNRQELLTHDIDFFAAESGSLDDEFTLQLT